MANIEYLSPTGKQIQGTHEKIVGAAAVNFTSNEDPAEFDHAGGTDMFWDEAKTQTLVDVTCFIDEDGLEWPAHHLIPADQEQLSRETVRLMTEEINIGLALDAAQLLDNRLDMDCVKASVAWPRIGHVAELIQHLTIAYEGAKAAAMEAKAKELDARQEPASA